MSFGFSNKIKYRIIGNRRIQTKGAKRHFKEKKSSIVLRGLQHSNYLCWIVTIHTFQKFHVCWLIVIELRKTRRGLLWNGTHVSIYIYPRVSFMAVKWRKFPLQQWMLQIICSVKSLAWNQIIIQPFIFIYTIIFYALMFSLNKYAWKKEFST